MIGSPMIKCLITTTELYGNALDVVFSVTYTHIAHTCARSAEQVNVLQQESTDNELRG